MITVLVPAHNEAEQIVTTIESLLAQTVAPDRIVVISDNSTDETVDLALEAGAQVMETKDNLFKKAGALNQALQEVLPGMGPKDAVLIMDADSALVPTWVSDAMEWLPRCGAVSGAYVAMSSSGLVPLMQHVEYTQQRRRISRSQGRVAVLSGAASIFYVETLTEIAMHRGALLPGVYGDFYREDSLTEDFEITVAAKELGYDPRSPSNLIVVTDVMHTLPELWAQRLRWQRGYLETLVSYPLRVTWKQWLLQGATYGMSLLPILMLALLGAALAAGPLVFDFRWLLLLPIFMGAELLEAWKGGWKARLIAVTMVPNSIYGVYRNAIYWKAVWVSIRREVPVWS